MLLTEKKLGCVGHGLYSWGSGCISQHHHCLSPLLLSAQGFRIPVTYDGGPWEPARKVLTPEALLLPSCSKMTNWYPHSKSGPLCFPLSSPPHVLLSPWAEFILVKQTKLESRRPIIRGLVVSYNSVRGFCSFSDESWMCEAVDETWIFKCRLMSLPEASKKLRFYWPYRDFIIK